jgi:membrane protein YdbS with pleckstrin-like domain
VRLLRIPQEPAPPAGSQGTLMVFRAAPGYYRYLWLSWLIGRLFLGVALVGGSVGLWIGGAVAGAQEPLLEVLFKLGSSLMFIFYVVNSVYGYATLRLDYELRWYMVTDRSLRIREGVGQVREKTMTFANIQNVSLSQGPLQRLFGISDLMVQTAGGGGSPQQEQAGHQAVHLGYFRGVDNAEAIRSTIMERLRRYKDAGLGDHDDPTVAQEASLDHILEELRQEARAFHQAARHLAS